MAKKNIRIFPLISSILIGLLIVISIFYSKRSYQMQKGMVLAQDIEFLANVIEDIDQTAGIQSFDLIKNRIDFLAIKKDGFVGSEIGSLNLKYPRNWRGPYIQEFPQIHEENYMILKTDNGTFITPADGVTLPNGKKIGRDIILNEKSDIQKMIQKNGYLNYLDKPLAMRVLNDRSIQPTSELVDLPEGY